MLAIDWNWGLGSSSCRQGWVRPRKNIKINRNGWSLGMFFCAKKKRRKIWENSRALTAHPTSKGHVLAFWVLPPHQPWVSLTALVVARLQTHPPANVGNRTWFRLERPRFSKRNQIRNEHFKSWLFLKSFYRYLRIFYTLLVVKIWEKRWFQICGSSQKWIKSLAGHSLASRHFWPLLAPPPTFFRRGQDHRIGRDTLPDRKKHVFPRSKTKEKRNRNAPDLKNCTAWYICVWKLVIILSSSKQSTQLAMAAWQPHSPLLIEWRWAQELQQFGLECGKGHFLGSRNGTKYDKMVVFHGVSLKKMVDDGWCFRNSYVFWSFSELLLQMWSYSPWVGISTWGGTTTMAKSPKSNLTNSQEHIKSSQVA